MDTPIRLVLEQENPWWRDAGATPSGVPRYRRDLFGTVRARLLQARAERPQAILMTGMRQVGKTVLARQVLESVLAPGSRFEPRQVAYAKLDDMRLEGALSLADILHAWAPFRDARLPSLLILDEAQKLSDKHAGRQVAWAHQLKGAIDQQEFDLLATGSQALELGMGAAAGPGRWDVLVVEPLSFPEFRRIAVGDGAQPVGAAVFNDLERYLELGGFPRNVLDAAAQVWGIERIQRYAREVLDSFEGIRDRRRLRGLFAVLMERATDELNVNDLSKELGVGRASIEEWIGAMEDAYLLERVSRVAGDGLRELRGNPKIHVCDPALVGAFARAYRPAADPRTRGRLFETAVFRHLRSVRAAHGGDIRYVQGSKAERKGSEVDFLLRAGDEEFLVEVTSSQEPSSSKRGHVREIASRLRAERSGGGAVHGVIVYGGSARVEGEIPHQPLATFLEDLLEGPSVDPLERLRAMSREVEG